MFVSAGGQVDRWCSGWLGVCLVCIDLVVVDVWVGECMGIWFLVPSRYLLSAICYLLSGIWYLVHFCLSLLLPGTSTLTCFYLPLLLPLVSTLTPSLCSLPLLLMPSRCLLKIGDCWGC